MNRRGFLIFMNLLMGIIYFPIIKGKKETADPSSLGKYISEANDGDTIYLSSGNYGSWEIEKALILRSEDGARASFSHIQALCPDITLWGLELTNQRTIHGYDGNFGGIKLINCIIHDTQGGMTHFGGRGGEGDLEVSGCIFYNNGRIEEDGKGHGHAIYSHNQYYYEGVQKRFINNIFGPTYAWNLHLNAASGANEISNYLIRGNIFGNWYKGLMFNYGGAGYSRQSEIIGNYFYRSRPVIAGMDGRLFDVKFNDNYMGNMDGYESGYPAILMYYWQNAEVKRNWIHYRKGSRVTSIASHELSHPDLWDWDENIYYLPDPNTRFFTFDNDQWTDFEEWKKFTGYDKESEVHYREPTGVHIFIQSNDYEVERYHVTIYNWDLVDIVTIKLPEGGKYLLRNAFNYYDETIEIHSQNGELTIPMNGWNLAIPYGETESLTQTFTKEFRIFVLERMNGNHIETERDEKVLRKLYPGILEMNQELGDTAVRLPPAVHAVWLKDIEES